MTFGLKTMACACLLSFTFSTAAQGEPWRLGQAIGAPEGLTLSGAYRLRYEYNDARFRAGRSGSDEIFAQRLVLGAEYDFGGAYLGAELLDSRQQLADENSPIGTDDVNAAELLRAYVGWRGKSAIFEGDKLDVIAGRITFNVGSRRLVARNRFRNTINAFTGIRAVWDSPQGSRLQAFFTFPNLRAPTDRARLLDNDIVYDKPDDDLRFYGLHYDSAQLIPGHRTELYVMGLSESDSASRSSRDRDIISPGFRFYKPKAKGGLDYEIETVLQFGTSSLSSDPMAPRLDHFARFHHLHLAYSFDAAWSPRLVLQYDYASGDKDPNDGKNGRFDTLFGARRFEFGPTGIFGSLARSNINTPGIRTEIKPHAQISGFVGYRAAFLAAKRDVHTTSGVRDVTGQSGASLGHLFETRFRFEVLPGNLRLEVGAAYLANGRFLRDAPNASPDGDNLYSYVQSVFTF